MDMNKELPQGWKSMILDECLELIRNGCDVKQEDEGMYPITRIETISLAKIDLERVRYCNPTEEQTDKYKLLDGDILFSHINSPTHIGKTAIYYDSLGTIIHGINLLLLRPNKKIVFPKYLDYYLKSSKVRTYFEARCKKSVNQASLNQKDIKGLEVIIPPLEEQERIVSILERAEGAISKRKKCIRLLDELVKSRFIEMFGDLAKNNKEWDETELSQVCEVIHRYPTFYGMNYIENGTPVIRIGNILNDGILDDNMENYVFVYEGVNKDFPLTKIELGDILMAVRGDGSAAKRIGIVTTNKLINSNISPNLLRIKAKKNIINNVYLFFYLTSDVGQKRLDAYVNKTAKKNIAAKDIKKVTTPVPPVEIQMQFADFIKQVDKLKFEMQSSLEELQNNFNSLMQRAFNGEL